MKKQPLLDPKQADQALRDLMPVVDWLTNFDTAMREGATKTGHWSLAKAFETFLSVPENSPAIDAYIRIYKRIPKT